MYTVDFDNVDDFIRALSPIKVDKNGNWDEIEFNPKRPLTWNQSWVFRGQADNKWGLIPKIFRNREKRTYNEVLMDEIHLFDSFCENVKSFHTQNIDEKELNHARHLYSYMLSEPSRLPNELESDGFRTFPVQGMFKSLALMQHIGLKTRLLDWSHSPLVAAYFAASDYKLHETYTSKSKISVYALGAWSYQTDNFIMERIDVPSIGNERMALQKGCFTVVKDIFDVEKGIIEIREKDMKKLNLSDLNEDGVAFCQLNLPANLRPELLAYLDFLGVNALTLFDSIYGLSKGTMDKQFIKYYGDKQMRFGENSAMDVDLSFNENPPNWISVKNQSKE